MTPFEKLCGRTWKWYLPLVSYSSRFPKSFVFFLVVLLGAVCLVVLFSIHFGYQRKCVCYLCAKYFSQRERKWLVWIQSKDEEKERCVSPFPIPPFFPETVLLSPQTYTTNTNLNFICINNLYCQDTILKTPFSYMQSLYQNTMKILTTETNEHV